jgi:hypothetical protein
MCPAVLRLYPVHSGHRLAAWYPILLDSLSCVGVTTFLIAYTGHYASSTLIGKPEEKLEPELPQRIRAVSASDSSKSQGYIIIRILHGACGMRRATCAAVTGWEREAWVFAWSAHKSLERRYECRYHWQHTHVGAEPPRGGMMEE